MIRAYVLKTREISIDGNKEAGLAGLFLSALEGNIDNLVLRNSPVSYLFDERESIDFFSMGIHLPGFLIWGDVSLVAALGGQNITFIDPVTMSGRELSDNELSAVEKEFGDVRGACKQAGKLAFIKSSTSE